MRPVAHSPAMPNNHSHPSPGTRHPPQARIRPFTHRDFPEWLRMRRTLWPDLREEDEAAEAESWVSRGDTIVIVAERFTDKGTLCGFAEAASRPYADGCITNPVAFLEGWYVDGDMRRRGIGQALLHAVESWARAQGFQEMGSDALIDNRVSQRAHSALGFEEVERAVRYRKKL